MLHYAMIMIKSIRVDRVKSVKKKKIECRKLLVKYRRENEKIKEEIYVWVYSIVNSA